MLDFKIDETLCTECGFCSEDCPTLIIDGSKGIPEIKAGKEDLCIRCQHCLAICPAAALSIHGKDPLDSIAVTNDIPGPGKMSNLIKTRRSVRKFIDKELDSELINELLQTSAYAPSGHNKNEVLLTISYTGEEMAKMQGLVYDALKKAKEEGRIKGDDRIYNSFQYLWESKDIDILFRNAPHILIASAPRSNSNAVADCLISLSYFELYASTHGVATLWDGFAMHVFHNLAPELQSLLEIPHDHVIGYIMVFGLPAIKYARSVQSEGLNINRIKQ